MHPIVETHILPLIDALSTRGWIHHVTTKSYGKTFTFANFNIYHDSLLLCYVCGKIFQAEEYTKHQGMDCEAFEYAITQIFNRNCITAGMFNLVHPEYFGVFYDQKWGKARKCNVPIAILPIPETNVLILGAVSELTCHPQWLVQHPSFRAVINNILTHVNSWVIRQSYFDQFPGLANYPLIGGLMSNVEPQCPETPVISILDALALDNLFQCEMSWTKIQSISHTHPMFWKIWGSDDADKFVRVYPHLPPDIQGMGKADLLAYGKLSKKTRAIADATTIMDTI